MSGNAVIPPRVQKLTDDFRLINTRLSGNVGPVALAYADAVLGRYNGEPDYINEAITQTSLDQLRVSFPSFGFVLIQTFKNNGIPFPSLGTLDTTAKEIAAVTAAFERIPPMEPYVFNCGAGMSPAGANLDGATECILQQQEPDQEPTLLLRLRLFLEGPLR